MRGNDPKLAREIAALGDLPREELVKRWRKAYGCPPPKGIKRGLLERAAAWNLQARRLGGLSAESRKTLKQAQERHLADRPHAAKNAAGEAAVNQAVDAGLLKANACEAGAEADADVEVQPIPRGCRERGSHNGGSTADPGTFPSRRRPVLQPGARLVREWNGRTHIVEVVDNGFVHDGTTYRSLSAIARRITGARWSGPRFFGL